MLSSVEAPWHLGQVLSHTAQVFLMSKTWPCWCDSSTSYPTPRSPLPPRAHCSATRGQVRLFHAHRPVPTPSLLRRWKHCSSLHNVLVLPLCWTGQASPEDPLFACPASSVLVSCQSPAVSILDSLCPSRWPKLRSPSSTESSRMTGKTLSPSMQSALLCPAPHLARSVTRSPYPPPSLANFKQVTRYIEEY